jgi:hypothetical protein
LAPLGGLVLHIAKGSADEKVRRINAPRLVALVANHLALAYFHAMQYRRSNMRPSVLSVEAKATVATSRLICRPSPTITLGSEAGREIYLAHKRADGGAVHDRRVLRKEDIQAVPTGSLVLWNLSWHHVT